MSILKKSINNQLLIDTGIFVALASYRDAHHEKAKQMLKSTERMEWITTWPVIVETCYMLGKVSPLESEKFLDMYFYGAFSVFELSKDQVPRIQELMRKYIDLPMDLADASLVILAEHIGHGKILSTDKRDFNAYRWKNHHPFENLFLNS